MSSLADDVTVIVTTSAIKSHPSTDLIQQVLESLELAKGLQGCKILIIADAPRVGKQTRPKQGYVDEEGLRRYEKYKLALRELCEIANAPFRNAELVEMDHRVGFGHAVLEGLRRAATEFVLVVQHDRGFARVVDVRSVIAFFDAFPHVRYVMMPTSPVARYRRTASSVHRINVDSEVLFKTPCSCGTCSPVEGVVCSAQLASSDERLVPLLFWYDSTHIVRREEYIRMVFQEHCAEQGKLRVRNGDFIEDTFGHWVRNEMKRDFRASLHRFGTFLYFDGSDDDPREALSPIVTHLNGNRFFTEEQRAQKGFASTASSRLITEGSGAGAGAISASGSGVSDVEAEEEDGDEGEESSQSGEGD